MRVGLTSVPTGAKSRVKAVLERHPGLKDNRLYYTVQRRRGFRGVRLRPELTERRDLLEELVAHGVAVVPGYLPAGQVSQMLDDVDAAIERAREGERESTTYKTGAGEGFLWRLGNIDERAPETSAYFEDPVIASVFRAYVSPRITSYRRELDYRFGVMEMNVADLFHFDNWRPICKAFLYLTEVGDENAPFAYLRGSHLDAAWRRPYELAFDVEGLTGRHGYFFPQEIEDLLERYGWEETVCTGEAGTLILADLRGLHRGTPLRSGRRVLLNHTFDLMNA